MARIFLTLPALLVVLAAPSPPPLRFAVIGDSGTGGKGQYRIARQMIGWHDRLPFQLTLMLGDNIYGGFLGLGGGKKGDFEKKFDRPYAPLLARGIIFRAALGNHDMKHRKGLDLIESYERFHIDGRNGYYSFTAGEMHSRGRMTPLIEFFVLNTELLKKGDPHQVAWLQEALEATRARWQIVYGHHPLYSSGRGLMHGSNEDLQKLLEPILTGMEMKQKTGADSVPPEADRKADLVLSGHDHIYERLRLQKGIAYFVCGSSGKLDRGGAGRSPMVSVSEDRVHVFMLWDASPENLRFRAINENGSAFDCGVINDHPDRIQGGPCESPGG